MYSSTVATILAATTILGANADFFIANTTSCYGAFPMNQCTTGVQVISQGVDYNTSFTCDQLWDAQSDRHIKKNYASPTSNNFTSTSNVCDGSALYFERNYTTTSTNGTFDIYKGTEDNHGDSIGTCEYHEAEMNESKRRCGNFFGTVFYIGAYRCNSTICGDGSTTSSSSISSSSTTTSNSTSSATSTSSSATTTVSSVTTTTGTSSTSSESSTASSTGSASSTTDTATTSKATSTASETSATTTAESTTTATAKARRWIG